MPSFRLELRYKLFELRDELRNIKSEENSKVSDDVFDILEGTVCTVINRLPFFSLSAQMDAFKEYESNKSFQNRVEKRKNILEGCQDERIKRINRELIDIASVASVLNAGGWIYIAIPFLLIILTFAFITQSIRSFKTILIKETYKVAYASDNDFSNFTHFA
ncbi:hypothetical protein AUW17_08215 [Tenacibaculum dicentrarchi]|nr:hypothetical protein AUW17_08215 [Tenacibaculum dicentrarchi]